MMMKAFSLVLILFSEKIIETLYGLSNARKYETFKSGQLGTKYTNPNYKIKFFFCE